MPRGCLRIGVGLGLTLSAAAPGSASLARAAGQAAPTAPASAPSPDPSATPSPAAPPRGRLRLDVDRHARELIDRETAADGRLRFETSVEVEGKSPQVMLERFVGGPRTLELQCGPSAGGPPSEAEMREVRYHPAPYLDYLAALSWLKGRLDRRGRPKYYLYRVSRGDRTLYELREGPLSDQAFYNTPGTRYELVESFVASDDAVRALRRMERGFASPTPAVSSSPPPPWVTTTCPPPR
jgi:hypothetical protein